MLKSTLEKLGISQPSHGGSTGESWFGQGDDITSVSPVDGNTIGTSSTITVEEYDRTVDQAELAFQSFRKIPAPKRGEMVRQLGDAL